ncbi:MAG: hypothetical protein RTU30_08460 [Candidatus Thorarchaeota archaeon]
MQTGLDLAIMANVVSAIISTGVVVFLLRHWLNQNNRIYSDLPLLFSITFISMGINTTIQALTLSSAIQYTMTVFRIRALVIMGSAFPLLVALLVIWLNRFRKHHSKIMILGVTLWTITSLIGPTEQIVMALLIPPLLVFDLGMVVTFAITWKTGRLKEVRSDLMVGSLLIGFVSQILKIPLQTIGLDWFTVSVAAMSGIIAAIALTNPWFYRKNGKKPQDSVATYVPATGV